MTTPAVQARPLYIALAGMVSLAVAMGIGRFAPTPLFPMMLAEGAVDLAGASWLASANYIGYLLGAIACTFQPWIWKRIGRTSPVNGPAMVRTGLVGTIVLTLAMSAPVPALWPTLRFMAGVTSSFAFIYTSGWALAQLARLGSPETGGIIYTGPGAGIVASGFVGSALIAWGLPSRTGWMVFALLAAALTATIWRVFDPRGGGVQGATAAVTNAPSTDHGPHELALLAFTYGLAGFGYIITATFLPVIARMTLPGSHWLDMFWPVFGIGVVAGALSITRIRSAGDNRLRLAICFAVQAAGVALPLVMPNLGGFALGSLLLGLPFTAITFFGLQEVRRLRPAQAPSFIGLITVTYGIGQIVGPPLAVAIVQRSATNAQGFAISLTMAAATLAVGAVIFAWMARGFPRRG